MNASSLGRNSSTPHELKLPSQGKVISTEQAGGLHHEPRVVRNRGHQLAWPARARSLASRLLG
jgi:hypothetical protein